MDYTIIRDGLYLSVSTDNRSYVWARWFGRAIRVNRSLGLLLAEQVGGRLVRF